MLSPLPSPTPFLPTTTASLSSPTLAPIPDLPPSLSQILLQDQDQKQRKKRRLELLARVIDGRSGARDRRSDEQNLDLDLGRRMERRQAPDNEGYPSCNYVGNAILTCYPESGTTLVQDVWSKVIWNAQYPTFIGAGYIDIYLFHSDSTTLATSYSHLSNAAGSVGILPSDSWWPVETSWTEGRNQTWPYYFVVVTSGSTLNGGEQRGGTFSVVQTAAATTYLSSLSSLSSASSASLASLSSLSSASLASVSSASLSSSLSAASATSNPNSSLQPSSGSGTSIPHWAIALLVVFGFLALVGGIVGAYFCIGAIRRRENERDRAGGDGASGESRDAMLAGGASTENRDSRTRGGITSTDATRMADAFRRALRRPQFGDGTTEGTPPTPTTGNGLMQSELEREGRAMQEVNRGTVGGA